MRQNVGRVERLVSVALGASMVLAQWRKGRQRAALAAGTGMILRGALGYCPVNAAVGRNTASDDTRTALGGSRGFHIIQGVTIAKPPDEVYRFWRNFRNLPKFMAHVVDVREIDAQRSHWIVRGPAGRKLEWDSQLITDDPGALIGWRTLPGADVVSAGSVRFKRGARGGTELLLHLQYDPPGGAVSKWAVTLFGQDPDSHVREDLRRLKQLLEAGEIPSTAGQPAGQRTSLFKAAKALDVVEPRR